MTRLSAASPSVLILCVAVRVAACSAGEPAANDPAQPAAEEVVVVDASADGAAERDDNPGTSDGGPDGAGAPDPGPAPGSVEVSIRGHAFDFGRGGRIGGAEVSILELPERKTVTAEDGAFAFDGLPSGSEVSLVLKAEGRPLVQTATFVMPDHDLERVTFQAPTDSVYRLLATAVRVKPDPAFCQIAATVTRRGNSLYDTTPGTHGEPDATVTIEPAVDPEVGPIYFNTVRYDVIYPDRKLDKTTDDGGVLFVNVPPDTYNLRAHKEGTTFKDVAVKCRAGMVVNAAPPRGLQAVEGGIGPREE